MVMKCNIVTVIFLMLCMNITAQNLTYDQFDFDGSFQLSSRGDLNIPILITLYQPENDSTHNFEVPDSLRDKPLIRILDFNTTKAVNGYIEPTGLLFPVSESGSIEVGSTESISMSYLDYVQYLYLRGEKLLMTQSHPTDEIHTDLNFDVININRCNFKRVDFSGYCKTANIYETSLGIATIHFISNRSINLTNVTIDSNLIVSVVDTLTLTKITCLGNIIIERAEETILDSMINIKLDNIDFSKLILPTHGVRFLISDDQDYFVKVQLYKDIIQYFKNLPDQQVYYDIQLQHLVNIHDGKWFKDYIQRNWDNYGYDKNLIFGNAIGLMLFFFIINLCIYPFILYNGYTIGEFVRSDERITDRYGRTWKFFIARGLLCFLYTNYIFWGLKLSLEKIRLNNGWLIAWIIVQYVIGIICLAYIANVIITK